MGNEEKESIRHRCIAARSWILVSAPRIRGSMRWLGITRGTFWGVCIGEDGLWGQRMSLLLESVITLWGSPGSVSWVSGMIWHSTECGTSSKHILVVCYDYISSKLIIYTSGYLFLAGWRRISLPEYQQGGESDCEMCNSQRACITLSGTEPVWYYSLISISSVISHPVSSRSVSTSRCYSSELSKQLFSCWMQWSTLWSPNSNLLQTTWTTLRQGYLGVGYSWYHWIDGISVLTGWIVYTLTSSV